ncbi:MAG TPA: PfkB family carbohydrate kinase [Solirubrobacteraceae bacterium]|nr:PfkB family carbohydrate kinase [Solirubrobacteraceae bacterium]
MTNAPILVGGEALYDLVAAADGSLSGHPGGGPFNTARTIGRLRQPVAYLGRLSTDRLGTTHEQMLADAGVDLSATQRTDEPSTLALASLDDEGVASYSFYAAGTAAPGLTPATALAALPLRVAALHVGTLGLVLEPLAAALEAVVARLAGRTMVVVDPNVRPWVIDAPAVYRTRLEHVLQMADVVKVSEEDLAWLDPQRPAAEAARTLLEYGPQVVLLTQGPAGATIVSPRGDTIVAPVEVEVVDTIGAGDAFGGGFLAWWSSHGLGRDELVRDGLVVEAARFAAVVAARTVGAAGASPPALPADAPIPLDLRSL